MPAFRDWLDASDIGTQVKLARFLGVTKGAVNQWCLPGRSIPVQLCAAIEIYSGGKCKRWDMRPDDWHFIWPELVSNPSSPAIPGGAERPGDLFKVIKFPRIARPGVKKAA